MALSLVQVHSWLRITSVPLESGQVSSELKMGVTVDCDGEVVKRFGFDVLGRHSIATFLMDNQENPAVVQAVMRHSKMDMTLYYSHTMGLQNMQRRKECSSTWFPQKCGYKCGNRERFSENASGSGTSVL